MSTPHRATREEREMFELRTRLDCLERRCEVQLQQLSDLQGRHHRLAGSVRLLEGEVVRDQPEPAPVATDTEPDFFLLKELYQIFSKHRDLAAALYAIYDLGRQHGAQAAARPSEIFPVEYADANGDGIRIIMEPAEETGQVCWVVRNSRHVNPCHEFPTPEAAYAAHQAPAEQQPAPAGGLVERVAEAINIHGLSGGFRDEARAAIREVAAWLRTGRLLHAAELLEQEVDR